MYPRPTPSSIPVTQVKRVSEGPYFTHDSPLASSSSAFNDSVSLMAVAVKATLRKLRELHYSC